VVESLGASTQGVLVSWTRSEEGVPTDHDPAAVRRVLLREAAAHVGHGLLFGFGYLPSRHRPERARDIHTVVFVHGLAANRSGFFPLQLYLAAKGLNRQYAYNHSSAGSIESLAIDLKQHLDRQVKGGRISLVAHSLGGLICRVYLQMLGEARRVDSLVTISTPHLGSHASAWLPTRLGTQLRPGGPFLEHLNGLEPPEGVHCVSFGASEDKIVLPPEHSFPAFGEHHLLHGRGHVDILFSPRLFRLVNAAVTTGVS